MSNALNVPSTTTIGETGVDEVITDVQRELAGLSWLQNSLGRVKPQYSAAGKLPEPWIYKANGEYYPAYPNDTLDSFSCIYAHDDESFDQETGILCQRTCSVIVWVDFKKLAINPPTVERLKQEVIQRLRDMYRVLSVNKAVDQTATGAAGVYPGFDVAGLKSKYLTYPYGGFRVEITVHYENLDCSW